MALRILFLAVLQKIFLDTTRLLAEKTNNLLEEIWNYLEDGKLTQSAVLLLAAQEKIRGGFCSSKIDSSTKKDGFAIINTRILRLLLALRWGKGSNGMEKKLLEEKEALIACTGLLVDVISRAGEPLSAYIQAHSEVPHVEVLEHVSSILKDYGFCTTGEVMDTLYLRPYDCKMSARKSCSKGLTDVNGTMMETGNLHAAKKKAARKKVGGGWDPAYTRRSFFPYWGSVLQARFPLKVYPAYAFSDPRSGLNHKLGPTPNRKLGPVGRTSLLSSNHQPRRSFVTAATGAFRLLKVLK